MTRPLFEPTQPRRVATNEWGVDQLQRRPAPSGSSPIDLFAWESQQSVGPLSDDLYHIFPMDYTDGADPIANDVVDYDLDNKALIFLIQGAMFITVRAQFGFPESTDAPTDYYGAVALTAASTVYDFSMDPTFGTIPPPYPHNVNSYFPVGSWVWPQTVDPGIPPSGPDDITGYWAGSAIYPTWCFLPFAPVYMQMWFKHNHASALDVNVGLEFGFWRDFADISPTFPP